MHVLKIIENWIQEGIGKEPLFAGYRVFFPPRDDGQEYLMIYGFEEPPYVGMKITLTYEERDIKIYFYHEDGRHTFDADCRMNPSDPNFIDWLENQIRNPPPLFAWKWDKAWWKRADIPR